MSTYLSGIGSDEVADVWHQVAGVIDMALDYSIGEYPLDYIYRCVSEGTMQLWVGHEDNEIRYVVVTQITTRPSGLKTCTIVATAGEGMKDWIDNIEQLDAWCVSQGVDEILIYGRPGWKRVLSQYGFEHAYTVMRRQVDRRH